MLVKGLQNVMVQVWHCSPSHGKYKDTDPLSLPGSPLADTKGAKTVTSSPGGMATRGLQHVFPLQYFTAL